MSLKPITREEMFLAKAGGEDVGELKPITRREKFLDRIADGGGADLLETVGGDTLTWDGNSDIKVLVDAESGIYSCYVSDAIPTKEDFNNGFVFVASTNDIMEITPDMVTEMVIEEVDGSITAAYGSLAVIPSDNFTDQYGVVFPKKGCYLMSSPEVYYTSLTINGYTGFTKTVLKEEYLPMDKIIALVKASL